MPLYKGSTEIAGGKLYKATTNIQVGYKQTAEFFVNSFAVDYVLVGAGGCAGPGSPQSAGAYVGGGGGGGYLTSWSNETGGGPSGVNGSALELQVGVTYTISVGNIRTNIGTDPYGQGNVSITGGAISLTANEGGFGGNYNANGGNGGSGGGGGRGNASGQSAGTGNQGYDGAVSTTSAPGAGGGAGSAGVPLGGGSGGQGGDAKITTITGSNIYVGAGGGRGASSFNPTGYGGPGSGVSDPGSSFTGPYLGAAILRCPTTTYNRMTISGVAASVSTSGSDTILQFGHATGNHGITTIQIA